MASPDKLPEGTTAPTAAPTAPTEKGVNPDAAAKEILQKAGEAQNARVELAETAAPKPAVVQEGTDTDADSETERTPPSTEMTTTTQEKPKTGWAGFVSSLSAGWGKISEWLGDAGKKIGDWIRDLMGIKIGGEGVDPDEDEDTDDDYDTDTDTFAPFATPERMVEDTEMLTPKAPVFSFGKDFSGTPHVSDVPAVRPVHPVTGELNVPHEGVDIPAPVGTPLYATKPITIDSMETGTLKGHLDDGTKVVFRHVSKIAPFKVGDRVPKGTWLADTGNVGVSSGPHLHFEVNDGESDPIPYLDAGLVASAEKKIQEKKDSGKWIPLESDEHEHGLA